MTAKETDVIPTMKQHAKVNSLYTDLSLWYPDTDDKVSLKKTLKKRLKD